MLFKFIIRNLKKRPFLNLIKVIGLSFGLIGVLFISLFLKTELSYDNFHKKADRIFRLTTTNIDQLENNHFARIYNSEELPNWTNQVSSIENFVRLAPLRGGLVLHKEQFYPVSEAFASDSSFFEVFDSELLKGSKSSLLVNPGSAVISESFAYKVFGKSDAIGKIISLPAGQFNAEKADFIIEGIMKDFPQNSHFHPDLIVHPEHDKIIGWAYVYLLLKANVNVSNVKSSLSQIMTESLKQTQKSQEIEVYLQNIQNIHLNSALLREIEPNGNLMNLYSLSLAALILLFIAMSNFISLNLGMAEFFKKFISLNQVLGSSRRINFIYFLTESIIIVLLSLVIVGLSIAKINTTIYEYYQINLSSGNLLFTLGVISVYAFIAVVCGILPLVGKQNNGFSFNKNLKIKDSGYSFKFIFIAQNAFVLILLISVIVISRQTNFALEQSMGTKEDNVVCITSIPLSVQKDFGIFKSELLKQSTVLAVSAMLDPPGGETHDMFDYEMEGQPNNDNKDKPIGVFPCDYSFANLFGIHFLSGSNFTENNVDKQGIGEYIINQTALTYLGFNNPNEVIGKRFKLISPVDAVNLPNGTIVGIIKDFHLSALKSKVEPLVLFKRSESWLPNIVISYNPQMEKRALFDIEETWKRLFPKYPISYEHVGTMYKNAYKTEMLQAKLLTLFTIISLFICSMGLLGISLMIAQRKIKEIGIRKVNGAKTSEIMVMLNLNFIKWMAIAFIVAIPLAYYATNRWLQAFVYKVNISWEIFAVSGLFCLTIALITVSWQSWCAARANPVISLKNE